MSAPVLTPERAAVLDRLVAEEEAAAAEQARAAEQAAQLEARRAEQRAEMREHVAVVEAFEIGLPARIERIAALIADLAAAGRELDDAHAGALVAHRYAYSIADELGVARPGRAPSGVPSVQRAARLDAARRAPDLITQGMRLPQWVAFEQPTRFDLDHAEDPEREARNRAAAEAREAAAQREHDAIVAARRAERDEEERELKWRHVPRRPAPEPGISKEDAAEALAAVNRLASRAGG